MTKKKSSVAVLGAGISGMSIAYALKKKDIEVTVYEKSGQVGGVIKSKTQNGWLIEQGPNTLMARSEEVWDLLEELNLVDRIEEAGQLAKKRFIVKESRPQPLPMSLTDFIKTDLLTGKAKLRLFKEPFIHAENKPDESIADFVVRRFGKEVLDYAVNPFVAGIFAGDPKILSVKHTFKKLYELERNFGSVSKGMFANKSGKSGKKALISFSGGLQTLPEAMRDKLGDAIKLDYRINALEYSGDRWSLEFENEETANHDIIISCLPAHVLSSIMQEERVEKITNQLNKITYAPMSIIHLGYKKEQIRHPLDGFGMLVPEVENFEILGTLFSSSLFPGRAPDDYALLTTFIGGARNPELAHKSKDILVEKVQLELDQLLGVAGTPEFVGHTYWEKAIPQYEVGYDSYLEAMRKAEEELPGFFISGNIRGGVSVPDCISNGFETAEKIALLLNT